MDLKLKFELKVDFELNCVKNLPLDIIETESKPKEMMDAVLKLTILIVEERDSDRCLPLSMFQCHKSLS